MFIYTQYTVLFCASLFRPLEMVYFKSCGCCVCALANGAGSWILPAVRNSAVEDLTKSLLQGLEQSSRQRRRLHLHTLTHTRTQTL